MSREIKKYLYGLEQVGSKLRYPILQSRHHHNVHIETSFQKLWDESEWMDSEKWPKTALQHIPRKVGSALRLRNCATDRWRQEMRSRGGGSEVVGRPALLAVRPLERPVAVKPRSLIITMTRYRGPRFRECLQQVLQLFDDRLHQLRIALLRGVHVVEHVAMLDLRGARHEELLPVRLNVNDRRLLSQTFAQ